MMYCMVSICACAEACQPEFLSMIGMEREDLSYISRGSVVEQGVKKNATRHWTVGGGMLCGVTRVSTTVCNKIFPIIATERSLVRTSGALYVVIVSEVNTREGSGGQRENNKFCQWLCPIIPPSKVAGKIFAPPRFEIFRLWSFVST